MISISTETQTNRIVVASVSKAYIVPCPKLLMRRIFARKLDDCPFCADSHKITFHGVCKPCLVQRWLDNRGCLTPNYHRKALPDALHLLQDIILAHEINDSHYQLHIFFVNPNKNGIVQDIDYGKKKGILKSQVSIGLEVCEQHTGHGLTFNILMWKTALARSLSGMGRPIVKSKKSPSRRVPDDLSLPEAVYGWPSSVLLPISESLSYLE